MTSQWVRVVSRSAKKSEKLKEASKQQTYRSSVKLEVLNMATGGEPSGGAVEATGSEVVFDHICNLCSDEQTKEAVGYCIDCEEWLCKECLRVHKKSKASRHHVFMNVEEMSDSNQGLASIDKCTEKCDGNDGKRVKYFCERHSFFGCSKCVIESHGACRPQNIHDKSTDSNCKTELQQTIAKLEEITTQSNKLLADVRRKKILVKQNIKENIDAYRRYKEELVESLNKIQVDFEDDCSDKETKQMERLEKIVKKCKKIEKASLQTKGQLEVYEDRRQHCNMFVAMKRCGNTVKGMKETIRETESSSSVTLYTFQPSLKTDELVKSPEGIGKLVAKEQFFGKYTHYSNIQAEHLTDISVKTEGNYTCRITGSALLPGHKLVLADNNNNEIKVIDTNKSELLSVTKIDGAPWGVCKVSDSSVAVTMELILRNRLLFFSVDVDGKFDKLKTLAVSGQCRGVTTTDKRIIVTYVSPDKIEIMDMNGSVLQAFKDDHLGHQILSKPQYVNISPDRKSLYVSNFNNNTVVRMSFDGAVTAIYKDKELQNPEQTAVDSNGMVYIAGYWSDNIHLITPGFQKLKIVVNASDGLVSYIAALSYCKESNKLYTGRWRCDSIGVFQLT